MALALQVYAPGFDRDFFKLPVNIQSRIEERIDWLGGRLEVFPHVKLQASVRSDFGSEIIASFMTSILNEAYCICSR